MIYWQYILIFAVFFYAGWNLFRLLRRIRRDHFQEMAVRKLLKRSRIERGRMYFNSDVLRRTIAFLLGCRSQSARRALLNMACGKTAPAEAFLRRRGRETDALLLETLSAAEPDKGFLRSKPQFFACLPAIKTPRKKSSKTFRTVICPVMPRHASGFVQGWLFLRDGDMLSASACAAEAVSLFEREKAFVEEAQALLLSGTVYRLSCVEDVAKFMFDAPPAFSVHMATRSERPKLSATAVCSGRFRKICGSGGRFCSGAETQPDCRRRKTCGRPSQPAGIAEHFTAPLYRSAPLP